MTMPSTGRGIDDRFGGRGVLPVLAFALALSFGASLAHPGGAGAGDARSGRPLEARGADFDPPGEASASRAGLSAPAGHDRDRLAQEPPPAESEPSVLLPLLVHRLPRRLLAPAITITPGAGTPRSPTATRRATAALPTVSPTPPPSPTPLPAPSVVIEGDRVLSEHYELRVYSDRIDKQEFGRLMEAYYPQAVAYFGASPRSDSPDGRLVGEIYHDGASYQAALARDGINAPGSGGYYAPWLQKFYLFVQPSRHYSRQLTLHEATHQMQWQAGGCQLPGWWTEGEPEFLGMHTWDGVSLQTRVVPPISLEDYPAGALAGFESKGGDIGYIVRGESGWTRKEAWGIIAFLFDTRPEQAEALRKRYCAGEGSAEAWAAVFGGPVDGALNAAYHAWLRSNQQPWEWVWNSFEPDGPDAFLAQSGSNAIAVLKELPRRLEVALEPRSEAMQAGILFNYRDTSDFTILRLNHARQLGIIRVEPGWKWSWEKSLDIPPRADGGPDTMRIEIEHPVTVVYVNDAEVARYTEPSVAEGRVGLNLENSEVRFRLQELKR